MDHRVKKEDMNVVGVPGGTEIRFHLPVDLLNNDTLTYELPWKEIVEVWDKVEEGE